MTNIAISVKHVSKSFKLPHEKITGLKQAIIHFRPGKKYEMQHVLDNISFDIKQGEFFGIVGRNGSGKSTLLKLLAQIYTPNKGGVTVVGSLTPFIELGVGFNPELTGRENVFLNGALLGFDRKEIAEMYDDIVSFAEIDRFMDLKLKNYSSGMQVRLAFSIAIRAKTNILLIDEVLAVGDSAFQQKCFNYFEELKRTNTTVVLVTHDMSAVNRFCTRALILENGKIKNIGPPGEIADDYILDNVKSAESTKDHALSAVHSIKAKVSERTTDAVILEIVYDSQNEDDMYVGISVARDGISVAEITTSHTEPLTGTGTVRFTLDPAIFNAGVYTVGVALFELKNRELVAIAKRKLDFSIKGADLTRGAALKLADTWQYDAGEA